MAWTNSLRFPYLDFEEGYWGEQTSTLNFCEEDYVLSYYVAEVCNTITNILFVWLGFRGIKNCVDNGHDLIFILGFVGYLVVGIGSVTFHATLKYPMQLLDELSMIYTTCLMMHASFAFARSQTFSIIWAIILIAIAAFVTVYYHISQDPVFHQVVYAILTATVIFRGMWSMEYQLRPVIAARNPTKARQVLGTMWALVGTGLAVFLGGFAIWNLDNAFCSSLRIWRRQIGLPWAVVLEGHAWWHLMTGFGAYYYIVWGVWLRRCLLGQYDEFELRWPSFLTSMPQVSKTRDTKSKQS